MSYPAALPSSRDDTIRTYDAIHELYDAETRDFWEKFPMETVKEFVDLLPGNDILNLGSGPGRDSLLLREQGLNVTCIDGSRKMVEMTSRLGFRSVLCDLRDIDLKKGSYDGTWAYSSLIHLTSDESEMVLKKIDGSLKSRGILFLGLIEGEGNEIRNVGGSSYTRYFEYYNDWKVKTIISGTSLEIVHQSTFKPGNHTYLHYMLRKVNG